MQLIRLLTVIAAALVLAAPCSSASLEVLKKRESRQQRALWKWSHTVIFFDRHGFLFHRPATRPIAVREVRRARIWITVIRRELRETRGYLRPPWPPHHALWMCIHGHEAGDWGNRDTGGNGHYGGLQMHPGWGYGTSHYASDDSQMTQEWAAERGYRAAGFSRSWLLGQWAHYDCAEAFA